MHETFFSIAVKNLRRRILYSRCGYALKQDHLCALLNNPSVLNASVLQSIQEFSEASIKGEMDEETRTASLMGHLSSNVNWYNLLADWTEDLCEENNIIKRCSLYWAHQSKYVESWKGADFGIAVRTDDDLVRISLYQAKRCKPYHRASLFRKVNDVDRANEHIKNESMMKQGNFTEANKKIGEELEYHQIHRLELWRRRVEKLLEKNNMAGDMNKSWIHYVFWYDATSEKEPSLLCPEIKSAEYYFKNIQENIKSNAKAPFDVETSGFDFGFSICCQQKNDLIVPVEVATTIIGKIVELGARNFVNIDETGKGNSHEFWTRLFPRNTFAIREVSGPNIQPRMASPTHNLKPNLNTENNYNGP